MLPTIKQMLVRANSGHKTVLEIASGVQVYQPTERHLAGTMRARITCSKTLYRWGCLEAGKITERGAELLQALRARN